MNAGHGTPGRVHLTIDARMAGDSGIGTYITNLVPRIAAARPGWRLTLLGRQGAMRERGWGELPNVRLRHCSSAIHTIAEQLELLARTPRDTDVFWAPNFNLPLHRRGRVVVTVHDVAPLELDEFIRNPAKHAYARLMFRMVARRAAGILCNSAFTRRALLRHVTPARCEPVGIPLGVSPEWSATRGRVRPHPRPYAVYVGNVKPHKNLRTLIAGFATIAGTVPHDLVIVGRREGMRTVDSEAQATAAALGSRVVFTGEVSPELLRSYVAWADALVLPSLYEGFGLPPLEAMAAGCPTLVARAGALPETCGDAALYCDPRDAEDVAMQLRTILTDTALQGRLRELGHRHVRPFTWERCARATVAVLDRVAASRIPDQAPMEPHTG